MAIKSIIGATCSCLAVISFNVNAVVLNTLNGINYEWMELTETQGLYREDVELRLADPNDILYGYEYASGELVEDLLLSYASWDGKNGRHGAPDVVNGMDKFLNDYGTLLVLDAGLINITTVDGYFVSGPLGKWGVSWFSYGNSADCGGALYDSCTGWVNVFYENIDFETYTLFNPGIADQDSRDGWDSTDPTTGFNPPPWGCDGYEEQCVGTGAMLVKVVPIPPAVWLFGSGLLGLVGIARRKKS